MSNASHLGYVAAREVIAAGRGAFFSSMDADLPDAQSALIQSDDRIPQFGYVGSNYLARRILLLGINPGNGPRNRRKAGDELQMPHLERFANNPTESNFERAQEAYLRACQNWGIWGRECNELLSIANLSLSDVAFSNALPWRTKSGADFGRAIELATAERYVKPLILDLKPNILIAVGIKVRKMVEDAGFSPHVVWNRARALTPSVRAQREAAGNLFRQLVSP